MSACQFHPLVMNFQFEIHEICTQVSPDNLQLRIYNVWVKITSVMMNLNTSVVVFCFFYPLLDFQRTSRIYPCCVISHDSLETQGISLNLYSTNLRGVQLVYLSEVRNHLQIKQQGLIIKLEDESYRHIFVVMHSASGSIVQSTPVHFC